MSPIPLWWATINRRRARNRLSIGICCHKVVWITSGLPTIRKPSRPAALEQDVLLRRLVRMPVLFGVVTDYTRWNFAFLAIVPLTLVAAALLYKSHPSPARIRARSSFDRPDFDRPHRSRPNRIPSCDEPRATGHVAAIAFHLFDDPGCGCLPDAFRLAGHSPGQP
jgi:hypothetical protein